MAKPAANTKKQGKRAPTPASWKPGQSGNPKGRPSAGLSWKELIVKIGNDAATGKSGITMKEAVVRAAFLHAIKGNAMILRELMQRSEPQADELHISHDWREKARALGLAESEVLAEAEAILNESRNPDGN